VSSSGAVMCPDYLLIVNGVCRLELDSTGDQKEVIKLLDSVLLFGNLWIKVWSTGVPVFSVKSLLRLCSALVRLLVRISLRKTKKHD
jgi:hypothetical protein